MGVTVTTSLPGVVNDIRLRAYREIAATGVMKSLVHKFEGTGLYVTEPYFDKTAYAGTAGTEGTALTATEMTELTTTRRVYDSAEWVFYTHETDKSMNEASEGVRSFHAEAHGFAHAKKLELKCLATFASFTNTITATSTSGLTWAKVAAGRVLLEGGVSPAPKPYSLVVSPNAWYYFTVGQTTNSNYGPTGTLADSLQQKYRIGSIVGGIDVYESAFITTAASKATCGLFSKDAIGLYVPQDFKMEAQHEVLKRGYDIVSTLDAGARVRRPAHGVKMTLYAATVS